MEKPVTLLTGTVCFFWREYVSETVSCRLSLAGSQIEIWFDYDQKDFRWIGSDLADGHFRLTCAKRDGEATLHRFTAKSTELEGKFFYVDGPNRWDGMWLIDIDDIIGD